MRISDVKLPELQSLLGSEGLGLQFGPYEFRVRSKSEVIAQAIHRLHAHHPFRTARLVPDFRIDYEPGWYLGRRCVTGAVDERVWQVWPRRLTVAGLEWITSWCFFRAITNRLAVHGAALVLPDSRDAIVFPGASGAGKSTLASTLMMRDWTLLSDEISLFDLSSLHVIGLGRPTILKGKSIDLINDGFPDDAVFGPKGKMHDPPTVIAHLRPTRLSVESSNVGYLPRAIVFPRRNDTAAAPRLTPINPDQTFVRLGQYGINYRVVGEPAFYTALELAKRIPAFELEYQNAVDAETFLRSTEFDQQDTELRSEVLLNRTTADAVDVRSRSTTIASGIRSGKSAVQSTDEQRVPGRNGADKGFSQTIGIINRLMTNPGYAADVTLADWDEVIPFANHCELLPQLTAKLVSHESSETLPVGVQTRLQREDQINRFYEMTHTFELDELARLLGERCTRLVLLKGGAYSRSGQAWARGRRSTDVDLLVRENELDTVAETLSSNGYVTDDELTERDQRYYRRWLHELPPLKHSYRLIEIDVHFRLLPLGDPKTFPVDDLIDRSVAIPSTKYYWLDPIHRVIHACTNLAHIGEARRALRDLWDTRFLVEGEYLTCPIDWQQLGDEVRSLGLEREVSTVLLLGQELVDLTIPDDWTTEFVGKSPNQIRRSPIYRTMKHAAFPSGNQYRTTSRRFATWALEHYPLPKLRTWFDPLTWTKRISFSKD